METSIGHFPIFFTPPFFSAELLVVVPQSNIDLPNDGHLASLILWQLSPPFNSVKKSRAYGDGSTSHLWVSV